MREKQHPVRTETRENISDYRETHPAYGQISASRVQHSGGEFLYGSNFKHRDYLVIRISSSELSRNLHRDHYFPREVLVEVAVSEAQWATFISTLNSGTGTPCTIQRREHGDIPGIAATSDTRAEFKADMARNFEEARGLLAKLSALTSEARVPAKVRDEARSLIIQIGNAIGSNLDFTTKTFGEHVETIVERAKVEIEAHVENRLRNVGLAAANTPLELTEGKREDSKGR
jgi:hypothetical protein